METKCKGRPDQTRVAEYPVGTDEAIIRRDLDVWASKYVVICRSHGTPEPHSQGYHRNPDSASTSGALLYDFWFTRSGCPICRVEKAGVDPWLASSTFDNFEADSEELRCNLTKVKAFAGAPQGFLVLMGLPGTGKSHLAVSILKVNYGGLYVKHLDLVDELRASYKEHWNDFNEEDDQTSSRKVLHKAFKASLLIIDELGVANFGNDADVLLYKLLDHRVSHQKPTVLVTNVPAANFAPTWGERIADRIRLAAFAVLSFTGPSRRSSLNATYLKRANPRL